MKLVIILSMVAAAVVLVESGELEERCERPCTREFNPQSVHVYGHCVDFANPCLLRNGLRCQTEKIGSCVKDYSCECRRGGCEEMGTIISCPYP